ncbi:MAG TPA: hypothetical protein VMU83_21840 [Hanamia sp.]|nr:hypothetical protein [Hanamia sp.]
MKNASKNATIAYYYPLLSRYASMLIGDQDEAEKIARKSLEDHYHITGLAPSRHLRNMLKIDIYNRCRYFKIFQIFDRPPVKVPLKQ